MKQKYSFLILLGFLLAISSCTTTKRKGEVSKMGKLYHNTTAQYNGYFNANELYEKSMIGLDALHQDNYNQLLPLYTYREVEDPSSAAPDLDLAVEKVSKVINLHRVSSWTDDCYLLLGKAQYLKQDFETAEKTFEYFVDEMNPAKLAILKSPVKEKSKKKSKSKKSNKRSKKKKKSSSKKDDNDTKTLTTTQTNSGMLTREPAYNEGLIWMGKTYIERERWPSAAYMISKLESNNLDKDVAVQLPVLKAYFFLEQKKLTEAIKPLQQAIELADKKTRPRYAYILAQIYEKQGNEKGAYDMYNLVLGKTSNYEMEFNAQLNLYKNAIAGNKSEAYILKELDKMLKEAKYAEYKDQIFFTKAEIKFKKGDFKEALKDYQLSLKSNFNNDALKAEVYYKLANKYFNEESYLYAKNYYDSTQLFLPKTDDRYNLVDKYVKNLNQIAINLTVIELQDSLIRISKLPREEQEAIALELKKERERIRTMQAQSSSGAGNNLEDSRVDRSNSGKDLSKISSFFAYNSNTVRIGKLDFQRKWDDRVLEDNWRRSNKLGGMGSQAEAESQEEEISQLSDSEFKSIMKDVPFNDLALQTAENKIKQAMLELGVLYRDKLNNFQRSADVLSKLIETYPGYEEECKAMYYLYLSYNDINEKTKLLSIRNRMIGEYPDCSFTQVLTDPDFLAKQMKLLNKKETLYQQAYDLYKADKHSEALKMIENAPDVIDEDAYYAVKFEFLHAMCVGKLEGKERYIEELENLVKGNPNTPEEIKAKEILRFIKGDNKAFETLIYKEGLESFSLEEDKLHYIFVVLYGTNQDQLKEAKRSISKYNAKFHKLDRLRISNIYLDTNDDVQIILVRKFDDKDSSMKYYYQVETRADEFLEESINFEIFSISQKNYREVIKQRTVNAYREFFAAKYLEQE